MTVLKRALHQKSGALRCPRLFLKMLVLTRLERVS